MFFARSHAKIPEDKDIVGKPVRQAIIPVAGLGTRFYPITRVISKEILPIINKPLIAYSLEEAYAAGIRRVVFVTGRLSCQLKAYLHHNDDALQESQQSHHNVHSVAPEDHQSEGMNYAFVEQKEPNGLGHALWQARDLLDDGPCAVMLPDDMSFDVPGMMASMISVYRGGNLIALTHVKDEDVRQYGIVGGDYCASTQLWRLHNIVEKPSINDAPSRMGVIGRYILSVDIWDRLKGYVRDGFEHSFTHSLHDSAHHTNSVYGYEVPCQRFDCGRPQGWYQANAYAAGKYFSS